MKTIIAFILCLAFSVNSTTYWVATDGDAGNPGTEESPWTMAKGLSTVAAGDTLKIKSGVYDTGSSTTFKTTNEGNSTNRVVLDGQGVGIMASLEIRDPYWTVQNVVFSNYPYANGVFMVQLDHLSHHTIITNCKVVLGTNYNTRAIGIVPPEVNTPWDPDCSSDCEIVNNEIHGGAKFGIHVAGFRNLIQSNFLHDFWITEAVFELYGANHVVRGNIVSNIMSTDGLSGHVDIFESTGSTSFTDEGRIYGATNILIERNWIEKCDGQPVSIVDYGWPLIRYGFTFRNNVWIDVSGSAQNTIRDSHFYNNTFYNCNNATNFGGGHAIGWSYSILEDDTPAWSTNEYAHGGICANNLFIDNGVIGLGDTNSGWYSFSYDGVALAVELPLTNCYADYNWVCKTVGTNPYAPVRPGSVPIGNGNAWDDEEFYELHGTNGGNPMVVGATARDFRLLAGSPLISRGVDLSSLDSFWGTCTNDFAGNPRSTTSPSIGAFEFSPPQGLLVHYTFADDFASNGYVTDQSGNGHHAVFYDPTNPPARVSGPPGKGSAWHGYQSGYSNGITLTDIGSPHTNAPYAAITNLYNIDIITNGTMSVWVQWADASLVPVERKTMCILDSGYPLNYIGTNFNTTNCWTWMVGHQNSTIPSTHLTFSVWGAQMGAATDTNTIVAFWPNSISWDGTTWSMYSFTWEANGNCVTYLNGVATRTNSFPYPYIRNYNDNSPGPQWICVAAYQHTGTPGPWYDGDDGQPNSGFLLGKMADLRIYNEALSASEVAALYTTTPTAIFGTVNVGTLIIGP